MKVAIASGKGGTGKTTLAINLALSLGQVQVLDCDVEDPDVALFLKPEINGISPVQVNVPRVLPQNCTYCRKCAQFCEYNALVVLGDQWLITPELCKDCGGCYLVCPENALVPESRSIGSLEKGSVDIDRELITGRLSPGEVMATPLIKRVKQDIREERPVIIDCPPGSACSMIHAVENSDYCLMVTEPTPFGLHDLEQAVEVVRLMDIPIGVVINRSDLGSAPVREYCNREQIPVLLEIPYDESLARAYARSQPAVRDNPRWQPLFENLWRKIETIITSNK